MRVPAQQPSAIPSKLALLGEAPGADEEAEGRPFVGVTGRRVFDPALALAGIERHEVWLGNVFEEKAPGNNVDPWMRDPVRLAEARARLQEELAAAQPTVIVPMGDPALEALTGLTGISRVRGSPILSPGPVMEGSKLLPTWHPAYILRQWKLFGVLVDDLIKAAAEADRGPGLVYPWKEFTLEPDLGTVKAWIYGNPWGPRHVLEDSRGQGFPGLLDTDLLSVDIETGWGQITCIGLAPDAEHAICIPFVDLHRPDKSYWRTAEEEVQVLRLLKVVLESPVPKLGQNFPYDALWLLNEWGIRVCNYRHDTRLMHHALLPELPKDLAFMAAAYAQKQWKHWGRKGEKRDE